MGFPTGQRISRLEPRSLPVIPKVATFPPAQTLWCQSKLEPRQIHWIYGTSLTNVCHCSTMSIFNRMLKAKRAPCFLFSLSGSMQRFPPFKWTPATPPTSGSALQKLPDKLPLGLEGELRARRGPSVALGWADCQSGKSGTPSLVLVKNGHP